MRPASPAEPGVTRFSRVERGTRAYNVAGRGRRDGIVRFVTRLATLGALAWVTGSGAWLVGCSSKDDGKTVAGRTRSVAEVAGVPTLSGALELARSTEQATGITEVALTATLAGPPETRSAFLRTPVADAAEVPLEPKGEGRFELLIRGPAASTDPRFPPGTYALLAVLPDAHLPTLGLDARLAPPEAPLIEEPADLALTSTTPLIRWRGDAPGFDLAIRDASSGAEVHRALDLIGSSYELPAGLLAPGRRYRLEVAAVTAPTGAPLRRSAGSWIVFDTEAGQ